MPATNSASTSPRPSRSQAKRDAILAAATAIFLREGYSGTNMDAIAAASDVSKQTVYAHFASKEALFVAIVSAMTGAAADAVQTGTPQIADRAAMARFLEDYAIRQLRIVMTPELMQLRRLVIAEANRFPDLGAALYRDGPQRALSALTKTFLALRQRKLLDFADADIVASHFNWLVMGDPTNRAMMLGDAAIPKAAALETYASAGVAAFLAAYATRP